MQWTPAAMQALEDYLATIKQSSVKSGADPQEVAEDIRFHIEEAIHRKGHDMVVLDDVRQLVEKLGWPGVEGENRNDSFRFLLDPIIGLWKASWPLILGVALPLIGLVVGHRGLNAQENFFPSIFHFVLGMLPPAAVMAVWTYQNKSTRKPPIWLQLLAGAGTAVAVIYTWAVGLSAFALRSNFPLVSWARFFYGVPLISLVSTLAAWTFLNRRGGFRQWIGAVAVCVAFVAIEAPVVWTRIGASLAVAESPGERGRGLALLRWYVKEDVLLAECYGQSQMSPMDVVSRTLRSASLDPQQARKVYYQVFGTSFNERPAPKFSGMDPRVEQAGTVVGGRIPGLSLRSSHFDVKPFPDALVAYTEWTLEFENSTNTPQEARGQIAVPPGGVVSRLTLWVDGKEREAVFHDKNMVQRAYRQIVNWRRDPVLVTSVGVDRVMVQCFPVPAKGRIKARLGMTFPMDSRNPSAARLYGPFFMEKNFDVPSNLNHTLWSSLAPEGGSLGPILSESFLNSGFPWAGFRRDPRVEKVWTTDPVYPNRFIVQETHWRDGREKNLSIVLDRSVGLMSVRDSLRSMFESFPKDTKVFLAHDILSPALTVEELLKRWGSLYFVGGQDNLLALLSAFGSASSDRVQEVLWIHGPQSVELSPEEPLRRILERSEGNRVLLSYQMTNGPHRLLEALEGLSAVQTLRPTESSALDLPLLVKSLAEVWTERYQVDRRPSGIKNTDHIARLWAQGAILKTLNWNPDRVRAKPEFSMDEAYKMAIEYRLVTPISGAVVLENDFQYMQTGLVMGDKKRWAGRETSRRVLSQSPLMEEGMDMQFNDRQRLFSSEPALANKRIGLRLWETAKGRMFSDSSNLYITGGSFTQSGPIRTPTWLALFPALFALLFQSRQISRDRQRIWDVVAVCFYGITYPFFPAWVVTMVGLAVVANLLRHRIPGRWGTFPVVFFLLMSLPIAPTILEGFIRPMIGHLNQASFGVEVRARSVWIFSSVVGLIVGIAPKRWPWVLGALFILGILLVITPQM